MKKAAILTIVSKNYGNRLQNYAMQQVLRQVGLRAETLRREPGSKTVLLLKNLIRPLVKRDTYLPFARFNRKIRWSNCVVCPEYQTELLEQYYDYFVIGSDQVWNVTFGFVSDLDFLPMVAKEKKVACAASFGIDAIPKEQVDSVKRNLNDIAALSVREESGAEIIRKLTGREAQILIDPTMMLDADEWREVAKRPQGIDCDKPYILTYFLRGRSDRAEADIQRCVQEKNLEVHHLRELPQAVGPSEFLYLIAHADLVMTDSFHACVFSLLFGKPFLVYDREGNERSMMSRIETLLGKFGLERKYADSGLENELFECDYKHAFQQLEREREKVLTYLKRSMKLD